MSSIRNGSCPIKYDLYSCTHARTASQCPSSTASPHPAVSYTHLLVIDDFGLMDLDLDKCRDLFEVLDTRDGRKSTVVISQFPVSTWFDMFADNTYAVAVSYTHLNKKCAFF